MGKYDDIINMSHHVSKRHPQMSLEARSAQFAPFAALTGYGDVINETGRLTNEKIEIDDELKEIAIAEKNEFINKQADMINTLKIFKDDVKEYLDYLNSLSGTQYNTIQLVATQDEEVRIQEMQDEMVKLIDDIIDLLM